MESSLKTTDAFAAPASLLDDRFEHDTCGVGFVASALGKPSHQILENALTALSRLEHRGAVAADGASSDGIGLMAGVPRALLLKATGVELADDALLGLGMLFLPQDETRAEKVIEDCLTAQEMRVLAWRDVPTRPKILGEIALSTMPKIRQVLVADDASMTLSRWRSGSTLRASSLSAPCKLAKSRAISVRFPRRRVYKAMCLGRRCRSLSGPELAGVCD